MRFLFILCVYGIMIGQLEAMSISEIMYDPLGSDSGREWIEIHNTTGSSVNVTTYKFFESGVNHGLVSYQGGTTLAHNEFAVIADNPQKFLQDVPSYTGLVFDSAFSLLNSGEELILKDASGVAIDTVTYVPSVGGQDDGSTLSRIDGTWVRGDATPGASNQEAIAQAPSVVASSTTTGQVISGQTSPPLADIVMYLPTEKTVVAGAPTEFSVFATTRASKDIPNMVYTWGFGDGGMATGSSTVYTYAYPGVYMLSVRGTNGSIEGNAKMKVRVIMPDITISHIGTGKYGTYVALHNPNAYDIDMSQWYLEIGGSKYQFPKTTEILARATTTISGKAMGFASTTPQVSVLVRLLFPTQEEIARHTVSAVVVADVSVRATSSPALSPRQIPSKAITQPRTPSTTIKATSSTKNNTPKDTRFVTWIRGIFR